MPVRAPLQKMKHFARNIRDTAEGGLLKREAGYMEDARVALRESVTECFLYQRDPDGKPWAERKTVYGNYRDSNPILFDLLSSFRFEIAYTNTAAFLRRIGAGVKLVSDKSYAVYHQTGTRFMVARKYVPPVERPGKLADRLLLAGVRGLRRLLRK